MIGSGGLEVWMQIAGILVGVVVLCVVALALGELVKRRRS